MENKKIIWLILGAVLLYSCTGTRKTASYYRENKGAIDSMVHLYEKLYAYQPFAAGFTDRSCKYYVMEVRTDTVRYVYNTEKNAPQVLALVERFAYDTAQIRDLTVRMKALKCLWLSKTSFYVNKTKETVTFLSFRSVAVDNPFVENKYYILLFLPYPITSPDLRERVKKGDLVKIDNLVYFTIGTKFR